MPEPRKNINNNVEKQPIILKPVGIVRNQRRNTNWDASFKSLNWQQKAALMKAQSQEISEIIINDDLEGALDGIEEFSHLVVLYWAHRAPDANRALTRVHPLGSNKFPLVGVFATHSPARPNSILATVVELLDRKGNTLKVTGLDALDGSPVLDIKPYSSYQENIKNIRQPDWMRQVHSEFGNDNPPNAGGH